MATKLEEIRQQYPQYNDMSDQQLADAFHQKFYADMPKETFYASLGVSKEAPKAPEEAPEHSKALEVYGSVMRPVIKGLSAPVNMVADGLAGIANVGLNLAGSDKRAPYLSQLQNEGLNARELNGQKVYPVSDNPVVKAGQDAVEGTVGALATGPAALSREMVNTVPKAVSAAAGSIAAPHIYEGVKSVTGYDGLAQVAAMAGAAAVGGVSGKGAAKVTGEKPAYLSLDEIRDRARQSYGTLDSSGITLRRSSLNNMLGNIDTELAQARFDPVLHPEVARVRDILGEISHNPNQPVSFSKLDDMRKRAGDLLSSKDANVQRLGRTIIGGIDEHISNMGTRDVYTGNNLPVDQAVRAVSEARRDWRNAARAQILDEALNKAEVKAQLPNQSEGELIRRGFNNIEADPKKFAMFSREEQNVIRAINRGGPMDSALSFIARFNPMRGTFVGSGVTGAGLGGYASGNPKVAAGAAALGAAGFGADKLQGVLRSRSAQDAVNQISNGRFRAPTEGFSPQGLLGGGITAQDAADMDRLFGR